MLPPIFIYFRCKFLFCCSCCCIFTPVHSFARSIKVHTQHNTYILRCIIVIIIIIVCMKIYTRFAITCKCIPVRRFNDVRSLSLSHLSHSLSLSRLSERDSACSSIPFCSTLSVSITFLFHLLKTF